MVIGRTASSASGTAGQDNLTARVRNDMRVIVSIQCPVRLTDPRPIRRHIGVVLLCMAVSGDRHRSCHDGLGARGKAYVGGRMILASRRVTEPLNHGAMANQSSSIDPGFRSVPVNTPRDGSSLPHLAMAVFPRHAPDDQRDLPRGTQGALHSGAVESFSVEDISSHLTTFADLCTSSCWLLNPE
ncbi:hypothetical protein BST61_g8707 [Cercospora zeina]